MKYSVEIHEKGTESTHGSLVEVVGVFDNEDEAWSCKQDQEDLISDDQVVDMYELYEENVD